MAAVSTIALVACSSSTPATQPTSSDSAKPSGSASTLTRGPSGTRVVTVTDKASGTTVSLHVGNQLRVVLGSTYWQFDALPTNRTVHLIVSPAISPDPSCIPGGGCGTVVAQYSAAAVGRATITAHRTSCGEALKCTPAQSRYVLTVVVS